jgi:hypothetical protein
LIRASSLSEAFNDVRGQVSSYHHARRVSAAVS